MSTVSESTLSEPLRTQLEKIIRKARIVAEEAAADAIRRMTVAPPDPPANMGLRDKALRVRLRAHGRTLGDKLDAKRVQTTVRLQEAAAYEIWHRMLFGRFLVERGLLLHPDLGAPLTLAELAELAPDEGAADGWTLAERYAAATLADVFKPHDPVLALPLDPFHHNQLQGLVTGLDRAVFEASDSLGWTYQFWRAAEKDAVNKSGGKIGAVELPAVTQLFTEPYLVRFLLHNTLGAWWAGKVLSTIPDLARDAEDEAALRAACALPAIEWEYLRFVRDPADSGPWRPAAGTFPGWPDKAEAITLLDPCCGSGHFLVEALPILAALRTIEEGLTAPEAARAVLRDNLHGLELDGRCVQIAAFAVALAAWRIAGAPVALPNPHLAWVGAPPPLPRGEMAALANGDTILRRGMEALHEQFVQAPLLGSLMDVTQGDLLDSDWRARQEEALEKLAVRIKSDEPERAEGAVAVRGLLGALDVLSSRYVLQATNVPFLGTRRQDSTLASYLASNFPKAKSDLATAMVERMLALAAPGGTVSAVTPQSILFQKSYVALRQKLLTGTTLNFVAGLGPHCFETISGEVVNVALVVLSKSSPTASVFGAGLDANEGLSPSEKSRMLSLNRIHLIPQSAHRSNAGFRIIPTQHVEKNKSKLGDYCITFQGIKTGDDDRFLRRYWELGSCLIGWIRMQTTVASDVLYGGACMVVWWGDDGKHLIRRREDGQRAAEKYRGVSVTQMSQLPACILVATAFDSNVSPILVRDEKMFPAVFMYCASTDYKAAVRALEPSMKANNTTLLEVGFDPAHWQKMAALRYPNGLPEPYSDDPTQWLFHGHPAHAAPGTQLHVALARLAGYRWPAETDTAMRLAPEARKLITKAAAALPSTDAGGLLPLHARGSDPALADRLRALLAAAFGSRWSNALEADLVREADATLDKKPARDASLDTWLRERAFRQHCTLFHDRPFLWQVTDGIREGFSAFLHYHRLNYANLEKLTYTVLGDWLARARGEGQTARAERARALQQKLEVILEGEKPYDIFVRWKPLAAQPLGWDPGLDDGVRQNIRPFIQAGVLTHDLSKILKDKDRGNDVASAPWYPVFKGERRNNHHLSLAEKKAARKTDDHAAQRTGSRA